MKTIRKISPKSLAKFIGIMYAIMGFIAGIVVMIAALTGRSDEYRTGLAVFGVTAPIFMTIIYGAVGWLGGYISAWLYNVVAKRIGGIKIEVE